MSKPKPKPRKPRLLFGIPQPAGTEAEYRKRNRNSKPHPWRIYGRGLTHGKG